MPELPEVEIIVRGLKKEITDKTIADVVVTGTYTVYPTLKDFIKLLKGSDIQKVERIAKVVVITLSNGYFLTFHLAMTGRLLYRNQKDSEDSYLRVKIIFDDKKELRFCDLRMFGYARVLNQGELIELKAKYGPTPFNKDFDHNKLHEILSKRKTPIKKVLLEQDVIAGLGNIYANDALWMSKIHPEILASKVTLEEAEILLNSMREILKEGFEHGGSTIKDFVDIYGKPGTHQNYFRIYGKENKPCPRCKTEIKMVFMNARSTFYCPTCQVKI